MSARLRAIARQTVTIVEDGRYRSPAGHEVDLAGDITAAVAGTRMYGPGDLVSVPAPGRVPPAIEVTGETSLQAARRLGGTVACLVFASAKNPGGGFRAGAQAQAGRWFDRIVFPVYDRQAGTPAYTAFARAFSR